MQCWAGIMHSFLNDLKLEAEGVLKAPVSQKDNEILNQWVVELEGKSRDLEKQLEPQQLDSSTRENELQARIDGLSREVDDAREEVSRKNDLWSAAEKKLKASLDASEKEQVVLIKTSAALTTEVHQLRREKILLVENLKSQSRIAENAQKEADALREDFDGVNYDDFCNCLQQVMLLNPGVQLNLRGLSVDHVVAEGVLTDICQPSDPRPVDLSNPELKAFDPWAPFVATDSEETESDFGMTMLGFQAVLPKPRLWSRLPTAQTVEWKLWLWCRLLVLELYFLYVFLYNRRHLVLCYLYLMEEFKIYLLHLGCYSFDKFCRSDIVLLGTRVLSRRALLLCGMDPFQVLSPGGAKALFRYLK
jgi:hypothetical protein